MEKETEELAKISSGNDVSPKKVDQNKETPSVVRKAQRGLTPIRTDLKCSPLKKRPRLEKLDESLSENEAEWQVTKSVDEQKDEVLTEVAKDLAEKIDPKTVNLTTTNVKSILHHLLTDKLLVEFTQRVALDASDNDIQASNDSETRITRSKWKQGKTESAQQQFIETDIAEDIYDEDDDDDDDDDEDEEYDPEKETSIAQSDDESISTCHSDLPSPFFPQTPETGPSHVKDLESSESIALDVSQDGDSVFRMPGTPLSASKHKIGGETQEEIIAYRTRSKISMKDLSLEALTASLEPPDYDPTLYDVKEPDELDSDELEWQNWLSNLFTQEEVDESNEDNDEDFNFMAFEEEPDQEEFRTDKGVRISQKELQGLLDGILDDFGDNIKDQSTILKYVVPKISLSESQTMQLTAQLQQHTQLLTQAYLLSYKDPMLEKESRNSKELLLELANFRKAVDNDVTLRNHSVYCYQGLEEAIRIVNTMDQPFEYEKKLIEKNAMPAPKEMKEGKLRIRELNIDIPPRIALKILAEPFFATYPELLPKQGVMATERLQELVKEATRLKFFKSEDNLLAIGLAQFGKNFEMISKHLLPIATPKQLQTRSKNLASKREDDRNPVKVFRKTNVLPPLRTNIYIDVPRILSTKSIKERYQELSLKTRLPLWVDKLNELLNRINSDSSRQIPTPQPTPPPITYLTKYRPIAAKTIINPSPTRVIKVQLPKVPLPILPKETPIVTFSKSIQTEMGAVPPKIDDKGIAYVSLPPKKDGILPENGIQSKNLPVTQSQEGAKIDKCKQQGLSGGKVGSDPVSEEINSEKSEKRPNLPVEKTSSATITKSKGVNDNRKISEEEIKRPILMSNVPELDVKIEQELNADNDLESSPLHSNIESGNCSFDEDDIDEDNDIGVSLCKLQTENSDKNLKIDPEIQVDDPMGETSAVTCDTVASGTVNQVQAEERKVGEVGEGDSPKERTQTRSAVITRRKKAIKTESFDWEEKLQEKASKFADLYFEKVKETLMDKQELYGDFLQLIDKAGRNEMDRVEVYWKLSELFIAYPDLVEMFVGFLEPSQAREVGKFNAWLEFDKARNFLLNCEAFFMKTKHYHQLLKKKIKLHETEKNSRKFVDSIKSLFRGNNDLIAEMSTMFPDLSPPQSRNENFEVIRYRPEANGFDHVDEFEEVELKPSDYIDAEEPSQRRKTILDDFATWLQKPALNSAETRVEKNENKKSDVCNRADLVPMQALDNTVKEKSVLKTKNSVVVPDLSCPNTSKDKFTLEVNETTNLNENNGICGNDKSYTVSSLTETNASDDVENKLHDVSGSEKDDLKEASSKGTDLTSAVCLDESKISDSRGSSSPIVEVTEPVKSTDDSFRSPIQLGNEKTFQSPQVNKITDSPLVSSNSSPLGTKLTTFRLNVQSCSPSTGFQRVSPTHESVEDKDEHESSQAASESRSSCTSSPYHTEDTDVSVDVDDASDDEVDRSESSHNSGVSTGRLKFVPAKDVLYDDTGNVIYKWTRDDDRLILTTCQQYGASDITFANIAEKIPGRSKTEIQERFLKLMELLSTAAKK